ncbi:MAG TPA: 4Fe-4S dicluster domain-containing protein [Dissulfurispiraceae bacterium]|nr:4Fe-4S dicluster domain-containing protein [Dissulfurispiraceae bacterium]
MKLRPPGARAERHFIASCIRCGKCAQVCPYRSIKVASILDGLTMMGTPFIKAREVPCYLCMKCPPVCPSGALDRNLRQKQDVRMGTAVINKNTCLPWQGTLCRSCYENCPVFDEAIVMDGELRPVVDEKKCIGCGICENVCPVDQAAITVRPRGDK